MNEDMKMFLTGISRIIVAAFIGVVLVFLVTYWIRNRESAGNAVTPVECICSCPEQKLVGDNSITADGYNVNIVLDGERWTPPALLSEEEQGYVTMCRKEDPELIGHPDLSFTKTYRLWHECLDDLADARSGFDDEANQCCWQQQAF